ncbi:major facilitator superfamily domain-containing protein [Truncatella angustata]|uniref:Major facilitator superfamily domain-containing protein n=1 Tax=Truncatella angustata TaxID=152316 RepID=A0A9P8ZYL7_9PEZI|nr:major facilitator superfamily domain-containing protein [Truncatella angustata]KAH6654156.1 major facilitator superfamily domain-containing protein [Truncatella angustata]
MATTQTEEVSLPTYPSEPIRPDIRPSSSSRVAEVPNDNVIPPDDAVEALIPDGGYGWVVVFACFVITFWMNGWAGTWGILQSALLQTTLRDVSSTTLSLVASLGLSLTVALGLFSVRFTQLVGARWSTLIGVIIFGLGNVLSGFTVDNVAGLFIGTGVSYGVGASLMYTNCNSLPAQWFNTRLGTANGIVKVGGGIGGIVLALLFQVVIAKFGIAWAFRILGFLSLATGVPAALLIKERIPAHPTPGIQWSLLKNPPFAFLCAAGASGAFALFVPSFFLPLAANSIGLSSPTAAAVLACFNACIALGRFASGIVCDKFGSTNTFLLTMALNAVTMLAIWTLSSTLELLMIFAALNGIANGAFFVAMPTAVGRLVGPGHAAVGMSMALTGLALGYFMGSPIAGFLIDATGADRAKSIVPYRPAIFYAGATAVMSTAFVLLARLKMDGKIMKKL